MISNYHKHDCRKYAFDDQMIKWLPVMITEMTELLPNMGEL